MFIGEDYRGGEGEGGRMKERENGWYEGSEMGERGGEEISEGGGEEGGRDVLGWSVEVEEGRGSWGDSRRDCCG